MSVVFVSVRFLSWEIVLWTHSVRVYLSSRVSCSVMRAIFKWMWCELWNGRTFTVKKSRKKFFFFYIYHGIVLHNLSWFVQPNTKVISTVWDFWWTFKLLAVAVLYTFVVTLVIPMIFTLEYTDPNNYRNSHRNI